MQGYTKVGMGEGEVSLFPRSIDGPLYNKCLFRIFILVSVRSLLVGPIYLQLIGARSCKCNFLLVLR